MNKNEIFVKWIEALRSGKYEKGKEFLKSHKDGSIKYCCLGVLCEVMGVESKKRDEHCFEYEAAADLWETHILPYKISGLLDFSVIGGFLEPVEYNGESFLSLVQVNDNTDITFVEMADIIQENLRKDNFFSYHGEKRNDDSWK